MKIFKHVKHFNKYPDHTTKRRADSHRRNKDTCWNFTAIGDDDEHHANDCCKDK